MIILYFWKKDDFKKIHHYLNKKQILFQKNPDGITLDEEYFVVLYKFLLKEQINFDPYSINQIISKLLKIKKFDDITWLYNKKVFDKQCLNSMLQIACRKYDAETVNYVLAFDPNLAFGKALAVVCWRTDDNVEMARLILDYGHNQISRLNNEYTRKNYFVNGGGYQSLSNAAEQGNFDIVRILISYGVKLHKKAIYLALENNHIDVAEYLFEHGATIDNLDTFGV